MAPHLSMSLSWLKARKSHRDSKKLYEYTPVDKTAKEIRLLTLLPGAFSAKVQVELHHAILEKESTPVYEALSYAWGSTVNPVDLEILCNGRNFLPITQNLAEALPYLRWEDRPRTLWIDAICIDQTNAKERGHQVGFMADIFKLANRVIVWLGIERDDSTYALEVLDHLGSMVDVDPISGSLRPSLQGQTDPIWADKEKCLPYHRREWLALNLLVHRPYFERLWVLQEALADPNAILLCGTSSLPWKIFSSALDALISKRYYRSSFSKKTLQDTRARVRMIVKAFDREWGNLNILLRHTGRFLCTDPRDKVYAILGLLPESERDLDIHPQYDQTISYVYQDVVLKHLASFDSLELLTCCEMRESSSVTHDPVGKLPSWAPDWTRPVQAVELEFKSANARSRAFAKYKGAGILESSGICVATIENTRAMQNNMTRGGEVDWMRQVMKGVSVAVPYIGGGSMLDAYCATFCCDDFAENYDPPPQEFAERQFSRDFLAHALWWGDGREDLHPQPGTSANVYLSLVRSAFRHRSFFTTTEGFIGVAPASAKSGDVVCVLLGCKSPLTLRKVDNNQYQVIGETYLCGFMHGEALLRPFPEEFRSICSYQDDIKTWEWRFLDTKTGNMEVVDPRLRSLAPEVYLKYEKLGTAYSPRLLTPARLTEWGVNVVNFELV